MRPRKSHTIRDIAREAGVSTATVSRFLNKSGYVDGDTAKRIEYIIDKYDFTPSRTAQSLKTKRSRQIMLVVPDISNPFYSETAKTIQCMAKEKGYMTILYNTNEDALEEINAIKISSEMHIEGIILYSIHVKDRVVNTLLKANIHTVLANSYENCPFDSVHGIVGHGTYLAAKHLLELGHRRIAFAGGQKDSVIEARRKYGYLKATEEAGLKPNEDYCFEMGFSEDAGYKAGKYFSALTPLPTAVCCANDLIALGILAAFNECGIKVPDDIAITGMDNIVFTNTSRPKLTTVTNDSAEFGRNTADLLFDRLEGRYSGAPREVLIPRKLIIRESTRELRV